MKKIEHEFYSKNIDYVIADSEKVKIRFFCDTKTAFLFKSDLEALAKEMGKKLVDDKPTIQPDEDGQCPHFIYDCYCGLPDGIIPKE